MTEIKALAIDLDGTLLAPDDSISARNRAAVESAVAAGWHVVLATARWYQLAARTAHDLGLVDPVVACSGAEVRRLTDGTDLFDVRLTPDFTAELYPLCDAANALVFAYQENDVVIRLPAAPDNLPPELRQVPMLTGNADPAPRGALVYGDEVIAKVIADLQPAWRDDVRFLISMSRTGASILTITSARADKGLALAVACRDLGIDIGQVVAMGDSETDVEMFKVAGASVAMGQSPVEVREAATWTTTTNTDDGVGRAIEYLLDGTWAW